MKTLFINIKELIQVRETSVLKVSGAEMAILPKIDNAFLLIDNNSPDRSCEIIEFELKDFDRYDWRIIKEPKAGQTYARLRGIEESKFECLLKPTFYV